MRKRPATARSARPESFWSCALGFSAGLAALAPATTPAQARVQANPHVGFWIPLGVVQEEIVNGRPVQRSQVGDLVAGGRVGIGVGHGFTAEGTLALSPGHVAHSDSSGTVDLPGLAILASARLIRVGRLAEEFDGLIGVGLGIINRSRSGWGGTRPARSLVAALGLQTHLARNSAFRAEIELHASRSRRAGAAGVDRSRWRGDVVLSFGIVLPSPRRGEGPP